METPWPIRPHLPAAALGAATSAAVFAVTWFAPGGGAEALTVCVAGQLLALSLVAPLLPPGNSTPGGVVIRGGAMIDAFGLVLIAAAVLDDALGLWTAIRLYLLAGAFGMLVLGVYASLTAAGAPTFRRRTLAVATGLVLSATFYLWPWLAHRQHRSAWEALAMARRADLFAAVRQVTLDAPGAVAWWVPAAVFAALAGLAWSGCLLLDAPHDPPGPDDPSDHNPTR